MGIIFRASTVMIAEDLTQAFFARLLALARDAEDAKCASEKAAIRQKIAQRASPVSHVDETRTNCL